MATVWGIVQEELTHFGRRMRGLAMISRGIVPNLVISQRVVDRVLEAARHFLADETGETMVGLVVPADNSPEAMPTLYVIDTIAPDESVIRRSHMFEQGDELQQDIFFWLSDNWDTYREIGRDMKGKTIKPEWNERLVHIGDWHKQPGYMIQPSGGDLMTALRFMEDEENNFEFLLVPIVTLGHDSVTKEEGLSVNYFTIPTHNGTSLRMDWWYIHRDSRFFQPITPKIVPEADMPSLTPYPWHILHQDLVMDELDLFEENGYFQIGDIILWNTDNDLPLEICFIIGRSGTSKVYLVVTDWDYPRSMPRVYLSEFQGIDASMYIYDIFQQLWDTKASAPDLPDFKWSDDKFLVDMVMAIEGKLGLTPAKPNPSTASTTPATGSTRVNIPVEIDQKPSATASVTQPSKPDKEDD